MQSPRGMASVTSAFVLVLCLALCSVCTAAVSLSRGRIDFYSDDSCTDVVFSQTNNLPLDTCRPASKLGTRPKTFKVFDKPYCDDGSRPSLILYEDCACDDGIANWAPNAHYGDYGNGSCQALLGSEFLTFVLDCGGFRPARTAISFSATFPAPPQSTTKPVGCPSAGGGASSTTPSAKASGKTQSTGNAPSQVTGDASTANAEATKSDAHTSAIQQTGSPAKKSEAHAQFYKITSLTGAIMCIIATAVVV